VYVGSNGWHTGIAVARADLPAGLLPETADFPGALWFEFGWGDADFYPAEKPGLVAALAASLPGPAVVHLAGLSDRPDRVFRFTESVRLSLDAGAFARLLDYLHASFARPADGAAATAAPGLYAFSRFYPATGRFHLFNTCNTWTAQGLETAGLPVKAAGTQRAADLMAQLRPLAAAD